MKTFFVADDPVVPAHHPRVLVDVAVSQGAERNAVLADVGISYEGLLDPEARLSYTQYVRLAENAIRATGNSALGLDFGAAAHLSHWGVLGLAAMNGVTAGEALRLGLQYYRTFAPGWDLSVRVEGDCGYFVARETISRGRFLAFATEAMLMTMLRLTTQVLRRPLPIRELRLNYPKPEHAARYVEFFGGPVVFDQPSTETLFDAAILGEKIPGADPTMAVVAERYCVEEAARAISTEGLLAQVKNAIEQHAEPRPTIDEVARELRTSPRSLRRGLQQMGTSYQKLLEENVRARAEQWLRRDGVKVEQVALELGFSDVRSFRRAFKRWTGSGPAEFRSRKIR
jgi:AraC-like DNA-binding protein